jgi:hypothetical protein
MLSLIKSLIEEGGLLLVQLERRCGVVLRKADEMRRERKGTLNSFLNFQHFECF